MNLNRQGARVAELSAAPVGIRPISGETPPAAAATDAGSSAALLTDKPGGQGESGWDPFEVWRRLVKDPRDRRNKGGQPAGDSRVGPTHDHLVGE